MRSLASQSNAIDECAFAWAAKIDRAPLNHTKQAALDAWLGADSRHAGAFARALATDTYLDRAAALGPNFAPVPPPSSMSRILPLGRRQLLIGGSALAVATIGGAGTYRALLEGNRITTEKGVIQRHALADGSSMVLNTETEVDVRFDGAHRAIALQDGEAWFDVVKEPARSFLVTAGDITVRAIGTSFSVHRAEGGVTQVVVSEGMVEVLRDGVALLPGLAAGRMARIARGGMVDETTLSAEAIDRASAWVSGLLDMNGLSLGDAAAQFGRYSKVRIELDDPSVAALRVSGVYSINNPGGFARDAALSLGLRTAAIEGGVRITRK